MLGTDGLTLRSHTRNQNDSIMTTVVIVVFRAYAEAGPSVQHSEQQDGEEVDFVSDSEAEKSVESSSSSDDEAKDDGGEGKKKKARSGFRDRKVIDNP